MKRLSMRSVRGAFALVSSCCYAGLAQAQAELPWNTPLETLGASLTGPIAKGIGVVALAGAGGMLAFGGELSDFTKRILMVVLALAVMILAKGLMEALFQ